MVCRLSADLTLMYVHACNKGTGMMAGRSMALGLLPAYSMSMIIKMRMMAVRFDDRAGLVISRK